MFADCMSRRWCSKVTELNLACMHVCRLQELALGVARSLAHVRAGSRQVLKSVGRELEGQGVLVAGL